MSLLEAAVEEGRGGGSMKGSDRLHIVRVSQGSSHGSKKRVPTNTRSGLMRERMMQT